MFDESKLPPVERWVADFEDGTIEGVLMMCHHANINTVSRTGEDFSHNTLNFLVQARESLHIQQTLGWYAKKRYDRWEVYDQNNCWVIDWKKMMDANWLNPYTAIVEAHRLSLGV